MTMMKKITKTKHFDDDDDENDQVISKLLTIVFSLFWSLF